MRKTTAGILSLLILASSTGCQSSPNRAPEGALLGGLIGAGAGMIVGNQSNHRGEGRAEGALIGGAVGAAAGALAGSQMQKEPQQQAQPVNPNQMSVQQIADLSRQGINEDVIVDRIRMSNSRFSLSVNDVEYLKGQGVTQKVISAMQGY
jgi:uncharacterized protein YcfJ